jgi:outer membrane protein assembly factor BamB
MTGPKRALLVWFFLAAGLPSALGGNSGGYRGPKRNGIYPAAGLLRKWPEGGPKLLWKYDKLGPGWASATVVDDTVYCIGGAPTGNLFAFTIDGRLKWKKPYGREFTARFDGTRSTPTVSDGLVIFSSGRKDERSVYCFDAATGRKLWHVDGNKQFGGKAQGWGYNESPLVVDDLVVFTLRAKDKVTPPIVALDKRTGRKAWAADPGPGDLSAGDCSVSLAAAGTHRIIVANLWRAILALDPKTGKTLWSIKIKKGTVITPTCSDGYLALGKNSYDAITMLKLARDGRSYRELWTAGLNGISQVVILDGKLFGIGSIERPATDKKEKKRKKKRRIPAWVCHDAETGKLLKALACMCDGSVVAADGLVYFMEGGEHHWKTPRMSIARPTSDGFEPVSSFTPVVGTKELWVSPTIAEGRLFIRHGSVLSVYDLRPQSYRKPAGTAPTDRAGADRRASRGKSANPVAFRGGRGE